MNKGKSAPSPRRILALIGSQRKLGNCEIFVKEIARKIPEDHDLSLIRLPSLTIGPCSGCYRCIGGNGCHLEDDISFLGRHIADCDALIIATPVYFLGAHASVKALLDRTFAFYGILPRTREKPTLLVTTYGMKDREGTASQALLAFSSFLGLDVKASVKILAALPGEALSEGHRAEAERLGRLLFSPEQRNFSPRSCPFCGNDIVAIREEDFLCTVCHGAFGFDGNGTPVKISEGWDLTSGRFVDEHREWLKGMKSRFIGSRRDILALTRAYADDGHWIEPT
jgi:NAD(P)H-dependent FMN reductase